MQNHGKSAESAFCFGGYTLDLRRGCLRADDREIELRPKAFEVLRYLVENAGRLISKDELIKAVWPSVTVTDESLARCMSDVRLALDDGNQQLIKTLQRRGYLFAAPVFPATAVVSMAAGGGARSPATAPRFSLVVLPFANLSGDPAHDHLADAITDGLTTYLSRIRDAFVIARTTALQYKGKALDVRQIGQQLGVRYVLEGSEQHSAARVRVGAQLIDVHTGAHLWAEQFDADLADLLQMQDEIVTRIARALQIELAEVEATRVSPTTSEAEDLALQGEAIFLRYGPSREESAAAFDLCQRALAIEPDNVRALSILAESYATRLTAMQSTDREADIRRAEELASRALAVDPNSYHAHHAKARTLVAQKRADEVLIEAQRSLRLNPGFIPSYLDLCQAHLMLGLPHKTIEYADRAMRLSPPDPYRYVFYAQEGLGHFMLGQDERAVACLRQAVANNPKYPTVVAYLAAMLAMTGEEVQATKTLAHYLSLTGANSRTIAHWRAMAYSDNPVYAAFRNRIHEGLRRAGMPEH